MDLAGKVVIVTGASAGIGAATTAALARRGAHVVMVARRKERMDTQAAALAALPGRRLVVRGDVRDAGFGPALAERVLETFGRIDVLINNAGIGHRSALSEMPVEDIAAIWETNVTGLLAVTQPVIRHMKARGEGHIVNVSSIVSARPLPDAAVYAASKAAVDSLSRSLRMALRPHGIRVTLVYPGQTTTEFNQARLGQKGGSRFGLRGVPPERVARAIIRATERGREEVTIRPWEWAFIQGNRLFPRLADRLVELVIR